MSKKCNYKTSILLQYKWEMSSLLFWYQPRFIQHYFLAKVKPRQHASNYTLSSLICTVTQCYHSDMITYFLPHSHTHYFSFSASFHQLQSLQLLFFPHGYLFVLPKKNVWSSQSDTLWMSSRSAGLMYGSKPGLSMPRVNTPQGQTGKTHKARSINYSEWRRLSVADKCVLQFHSCFSLRLKPEGWRERELGSTVGH